jgi:predicted nucleic acid-binding protein
VNVVVDASVAIKWFVPEPLSDEADRLLGGGDALFAPDLLLLEFGNTIWKKVRLGGLARGDGDAALAALRNGPVGLVATTPLVERALHLAYEIEHPLYDCSISRRQRQSRRRWQRPIAASSSGARNRACGRG